MKFYEQSYEIVTKISDGGVEELKTIENAARTSFVSEGRDDIEATKNFVAGLIAKGHEGPLEHVNLSVLFTTNRAIANELTRHRHMSFVQESTRYCNYGKDRFEGQVGFIYSPYFPVGTKAFEEFANACQTAERGYFELLNYGCSPEQARDVLPLATKTRVLANGNLREWRHIFKLRFANSTGKAHPMMRELMGPLLEDLKGRIPVVFDDI